MILVGVPTPMPRRALRSGTYDMGHPMLDILQRSGYDAGVARRAWGAPAHAGSRCRSCTGGRERSARGIGLGSGPFLPVSDAVVGAEQTRQTATVNHARQEGRADAIGASQRREGYAGITVAG